MDPKEQAKLILTHYIGLLMDEVRPGSGSDTVAEIETAVDYIIQAAVEQAKAEILAELASPADRGPQWPGGELW